MKSLRREASTKSNPKGTQVATDRRRQCQTSVVGDEGINMDSEKRKMIDYMVVCVNDYADRYGLSVVDSFDYLAKNKGLDFLEECYDVEHTLSLDTAIDDLAAICQRNERVAI